MGSHPTASEAEDHTVPLPLPTFNRNLPPRPHRCISFSSFAPPHFSRASYCSRKFTALLNLSVMLLNSFLFHDKGLDRVEASLAAPGQ